MRLLDAARLPDHPAWSLRNLLDVRPVGLFAAGHPVGAFNFPPTAGPLPAAIPSILLPPRHEPLLVIAASAPQALAAAAALRARGRTEVDACVLGAGDLARLPPGAVETGDGRAGLWRPPAFLAEHAALLPPPAAGPLLDLGCGSGRGAVWLALRGHAVAAFDRDPQALTLVRALAAASGVPPGRITPIARDLRDPDGVPAGPWAGVVMIRFLSRPLMARLPRLLAPGGVAVVRALRREDAGPGADRQHRLAPGELPRLLPDPPFELLVHREDLDPDGRAAGGAVARRRA